MTYPQFIPVPWSIVAYTTGFYPRELTTWERLKLDRMRRWSREEREADEWLREFRRINLRRNPFE